MGLSNYPPGVTGNEYAIGGAEREWEEIRECPRCEWIGYMPHEFHHEFGVRAWCANPEKGWYDGVERQCPLATEGFEVDPEEFERDPIDRYGTPEHEAWLIEMERQEG